VARSLNEARRQVAHDLNEQVRRNADAITEDHPWWARVADGVALRGIPAISKNAAGSALGGVPGSDAHLDKLDRLG
jgi:hypothetical protein